MPRYAAKVDANQGVIADALRLRGWYVRTDLAKLGKGWPDGLAIKHGRHVWFEVKNPERSKGRRKPNPAQEALHAELRRAGAEVAVVERLEDLAQFERPQG